MSKEEVNALLAQMDEDDPEFTKKGIAFDSVRSYVGQRTIPDSINKDQPIKLKLFYYGDYTRGYYNLMDQDDRNLQVFGKKIDNQWVFKCVTKVNMEEAGGYMILGPGYQGQWSSGHINFIPQKIQLQKSTKDYLDVSLEE